MRILLIFLILTGQPAPTPHPIVGMWTGHGETIEFTADGVFTYGGERYRYRIDGVLLYLETPQGEAAAAFVIDGDTLQMLLGGELLTYRRSSGAPSAPDTPVASSAPASVGSVASELVGKWCWVNVTTTNTGGSTSERCITLNADGTYEYRSDRSMSVNTQGYAGGTSSSGYDRGRWTYDGQRIHYQSAAGQGSGSYRLEKRNHPRNRDPMIVLDGEAYVTYYQKPSW